MLPPHARSAEPLIQLFTVRSVLRSVAAGALSCSFRNVSWGPYQQPLPLTVPDPSARPQLFESLRKAAAKGDVGTLRAALGENSFPRTLLGPQVAVRSAQG